MTINVQKLGSDSPQKGSREGAVFSNAPVSIYDMIFVDGTTLKAPSELNDLTDVDKRVLSFNEVLTKKANPQMQFSPDNTINYTQKVSDDILVQSKDEASVPENLFVRPSESIIPSLIEGRKQVRVVVGQRNDEVIELADRVLQVAESAETVPLAESIDTQTDAKQIDDLPQSSVADKSNEAILSILSSVSELPVPDIQNTEKLVMEEMSTAEVHILPENNLPETQVVQNRHLTNPFSNLPNLCDNGATITQDLPNVPKHWNMSQMSYPQGGQPSLPFQAAIPNPNQPDLPVQAAISNPNQPDLPVQAAIPTPDSQTFIPMPDYLASGKDVTSVVEGPLQNPFEIKELAHSDTKVLPSNQSAAGEFQENWMDAFGKIEVSTTDGQAKLQLSTADVITKQLTDSIRSADLSDNQLRIQLNPKELGQIRITFEDQQDEVVGIIEVSQLATRQQIQALMPGLIHDIRNAGVDVKQLTVSDQLLDQSFAEQGRQFAQQHTDPDLDRPTRSQKSDYKSIVPVVGNPVNNRINLSGGFYGESIDLFA